MDDAVKIIGAIGGWPIAIALITGLFFLVFRSDIAAFIGRTKAVTVNKDGINTQAIEQQRAEAVAPAEVVAGDEPAVAVVGAAAHRLMVGVHESAFMQSVADDVQATMRGQGLDPTGEPAQVLLRHFAAASAYLSFEDAYYGILGSQIALLKDVNQGRIRTRPQMEAAFERTSASFPEAYAGWNVDTYLAYLITNMLIRRDDDLYTITVKGSDFLVWMARLARSEQKAF